MFRSDPSAHLTQVPTCRGRESRLAGFTLAETLVALGVSVTLLAALLPVYFQAVTATLSAHDQSMTVMLAVAKLEQLRALPYRFDEVGGGALVRVTDASTDATADGLEAGGHGLSPSPPGSLLRDTDGFVDYLDAAGRWVGRDGTPAVAAYVRRWALTPVPASPEDALVLQVLVAPVAQERRGGPRVDATRRPGDTWLALVRARVQ